MVTKLFMAKLKILTEMSITLGADPSLPTASDCNILSLDFPNFLQEIL